MTTEEEMRKTLGELDLHRAKALRQKRTRITELERVVATLRPKVAMLKKCHRLLEAATVQQALDEAIASIARLRGECQEGHSLQQAAKTAFQQ